MPHRTQERGSALLVSLVFLLLLTMIGISSIQDSTLQERMAGNNHDREAAFQAAEAGLRAAERYLQGAVIGPFNGTNGLYPSDSASVPDWKAQTHSHWKALASNTIQRAASQPEYIIVEYKDAALTGLAADEPLEISYTYRVTARGYGITPDSRVVLQSAYRR